MKAFLETYGIAIFTLVIIAILIAFAGPLGNVIKKNTNTQIQNVTEIASERIKNHDRAEEPKEATDYVYAYLDKNQELVISSVDLQPNEDILYDNESNFGKCILVNDGDQGQKWWSKKENILTVRFEGSVKPTSCYEWFDSHKNLIKIKNIENLYTDECINMFAMFWRCYKLEELDVSNFNTSKVTNMQSMFASCSSLTVLDINTFDTSNVITMAGMFYNCSSLTNLDVSNFDTSNVTMMNSMFSNCSSLTTIDLGNKFDTSKVTNKSSMFTGCSKLITIKTSQAIADALNAQKSTNKLPARVTFDTTKYHTA